MKINSTVDVNSYVHTISCSWTFVLKHMIITMSTQWHRYIHNSYNIIWWKINYSRSLYVLQPRQFKSQYHKSPYKLWQCFEVGSCGAWDNKCVPQSHPHLVILLRLRPKLVKSQGCNAHRLCLYVPVQTWVINLRYKFNHDYITMEASTSRQNNQLGEGLEQICRVEINLKTIIQQNFVIHPPPLPPTCTIKS